MQRCIAGLAALVFCTLTWAAHGAERAVLPGPIPAMVLRVVDGDTVDVRARVWLGKNIVVRVRLAGIDAPEHKSRCAAERRLADQAHRQMQRLVGGSQVALRQVRYAKYAGRVIAEVWTPQAGKVSSTMLSAGLARAYLGRARRGWCCDNRLCRATRRFGLTQRAPLGHSTSTPPAHEIARSIRP